MYVCVFLNTLVPTTPVVVNLERTEIIVSEEVGMVDVCVSAVDAGSTVISVSMTDNPGNTNQGKDFSDILLDECVNLHQMCLYRLIATNVTYCGILISRP